MAIRMPTEMNITEKYVQDANRMAQNILAYGKLGKPFLLFVHKSIDGDCIGSACGMADVLRQMGYSAYVAMPEKLLDNMAYMGVEDLLIFPYVDELPFEDYIAFAVDCSEAHRMGYCGTLFDQKDAKLIIDHHVSVELRSEFYWINGSVSSASELCYYTVKELMKITGNGDILTKRAAQSFLTGIVTDTGRFTYTNTKPETLLSSGELMSAGGDVSEICYNLFDRIKLNDFRLEAELRTRAEFYAGGKIAMIRIKREDFEKFGAGNEAIDALPSALRDIDGVELSVVIREASDRIRVNLRSQSYFNCAEFATSLGGGGHIRSSGFSRELDGPQTLDEIADDVIRKASEII